MRFFPIRPLKVTKKAATASVVAIGLLISLVPLAVLILLFAFVYPGLDADSKIVKNPAKAPQAVAHGDVVSAVVLSTADLPINYSAQDGEKFHARRLAFVFGEFHHQGPVRVYYLKDHPEIGSTSWALEALALRWATFWTFATLFAIGVLLVWALTIVAIQNLHSPE